MTIQGLLDKVKTLNAELPAAIPAIARETSYEIEVLNKQQLYSGKTNEKHDIIPGYKSGRYAREKNYLNPLPGLGTPDLFLTGAFYQGFTVKVTSKTFEVDSINSKSSNLKKQYSDDIFGLTKENIKVYALGVYYTAFQKYVTLKTGLIFT